MKDGRWDGVRVGAEATPRQLWCQKTAAAKRCGNRSLSIGVTEKQLPSFLKSLNQSTALHSTVKVDFT